MITDNAKHVNTVLNTILEINARLLIVVQTYKKKPTIESFKVLDDIIARIRETKRAIIYLKNVDGQ